MMTTRNPVSTAPPSVDSPVSGVAYGGLRVLVVDDDPVVRRSLVRVLKSSGMLVAEATNGVQSLAVLTMDAFDCIVTDISMPNMDGVRLLRAAKRLDPHVQIILVTGSPNLETAIAGVDEGCFKYLRKPIELLTLPEEVMKASKLGRMARAETSLRRTAPGVRAISPTLEAPRATSSRAVAEATVAYQPIVSAGTRTTFGFEALLHYGDPEREAQLGRLVRTSAGKAFASARPRELLFVDLHPVELMESALVDWGGGLIHLASRTVLEISERAALGSVPDAARRVSALRKMGFRIAIADIGATESGMSSFARFEPDFLKLDASLVHGIDKNEEKCRVVETIVGLCLGLRIAVIADGVETVAEAVTLCDLGCELFQGNLFGQPSPDLRPPVWPAPLR